MPVPARPLLVALSSPRYSARPPPLPHTLPQPNSDGGWAYEIVQNVLDTSIITYAEFFAYIEDSLSTRDPCKGEFDVEPPVVPAGAATLDPAGTCTFNFTSFYCLICEQQDVKARAKWVDGGGEGGGWRGRAGRAAEVSSGERGEGAGGLGGSQRREQPQPTAPNYPPSLRLCAATTAPSPWTPPSRTPSCRSSREAGRVQALKSPGPLGPRRRAPAAPRGGGRGCLRAHPANTFTDEPGVGVGHLLPRRRPCLSPYPLNTQRRVRLPPPRRLCPHEPRAAGMIAARNATGGRLHSPRCVMRFLGFYLLRTGREVLALIAGGW